MKTIEVIRNEKHFVISQLGDRKIISCKNLATNKMRVFILHTTQKIKKNHPLRIAS